MKMSSCRASYLFQLVHFMRVRNATPLLCHRMLSSNVRMSPRIESQHKRLLPSSVTEISIHSKRFYAKKGRDKQTGKGKGKHKMKLSDAEADEVIDFSTGIKHQMALAVEHMKQEYITHLTLRTSAGALDRLMVDTKDGRFQLNQLAQIAQKNPQMIVINLATSPQFMANVKEAISKSGMNLNPQQDGTSLFVSIPKVTREHRENLSKSAKTICDKTKIKLRDIQNKGFKLLSQQKNQHSEDLVISVKELIQNTSHTYSEEAEKIMQAKQKELLAAK